MGILWVLARLWIPALLGVAAWMIGDHARCATELEAWAKAEGVRIVRRSRRVLFRGPFAWYPSTSTVFVVTVEDHDGLARPAWVCVGDPNLDLGATSGVEVEWSPADSGRSTASVGTHFDPTA